MLKFVSVISQNCNSESAALELLEKLEENIIKLMFVTTDLVWEYQTHVTGARVELHGTD